MRGIPSWLLKANYFVIDIIHFVFRKMFDVPVFLSEYFFFLQNHVRELIAEQNTCIVIEKSKYWGHHLEIQIMLQYLENYDGFFSITLLCVLLYIPF